MKTPANVSPQRILCSGAACCAPVASALRSSPGTIVILSEAKDLNCSISTNQNPKWIVPSRTDV
jgi:hypothetical protein